MCHNRKKKKTVISGAANPMTIQTIQTYCEGNNTEAVVVPAKDGKTDLKALMEPWTRPPQACSSSSPAISDRLRMRLPLVRRYMPQAPNL